MTGYTTMQFHSGGLLAVKVHRSPFDVAHLVPNLPGGTGPIVCGLDRHDDRLPGFSIGGGIMDHRLACGACLLLRDPSLPIHGIDADAFTGPEGAGTMPAPDGGPAWRGPTIAEWVARFPSKTEPFHQ